MVTMGHLCVCCASMCPLTSVSVWASQSSNLLCLWDYTQMLHLLLLRPKKAYCCSFFHSSISHFLSASPSAHPLFLLFPHPLLLSCSESMYHHTVGAVLCWNIHALHYPLYSDVCTLPSHVSMLTLSRRRESMLKSLIYYFSFSKTNCSISLPLHISRELIILLCHTILLAFLFSSAVTVDGHFFSPRLLK